MKTNSRQDLKRQSGKREVRRTSSPSHPSTDWKSVVQGSLPNARIIRSKGLSRASHDRRSAFTLMEVLLVLAIMGIIMSMVVPKLLGRQQHANVDATRLSIRGVEQAIKMYALDHGGSFPAASNGLSILQEPPGGRDPRWRGPYLENNPVDAWGSPLNYAYPGRKNVRGFDIISAGPDRTSGTDDDIGNWDELAS